MKKHAIIILSLTYSVAMCDFLHAGNTDSIYSESDGLNVAHSISDSTAITPQCCVGAVGPMCGELLEFWSKCGDAPGGERKVSVGSILHDNCCIYHYPHGYWCNNGGKDNRTCRVEWRKAKSDRKRKFEWMATFSGEPDDISFVPGRKSGVKYKYNRETVATSSLKAPDGTHLAIEDKAFCESGSFIENYLELKKQKYGTCGRKKSGLWIGNWVQVNFLAKDQHGDWDADDLSGIGFVASVTDRTWTLIDEYGKGCSVTYSYKVGKNYKYSKKARSLGGNCPDMPLRLLAESGRLEFSTDGSGKDFMYEYYDLGSDDDIVAFKWIRVAP